jgi:hypothetical protein
MIKVKEYLDCLNDDRKKAILDFHIEYLHLMEKSRGSQANHQAWEGGYLDHIFECFRIADNMYNSLTNIRPIPFTLDSALIVLYFHDIEKIWKYTTGAVIDKKFFYNVTLPERKIQFLPCELNALQYMHGENDTYSNQKRMMNELAAFCHAVDILSARMWHSNK